ncbi:ankyrin repeat and LEM domain-containing protein 1 isoform X3 [Hyla sarda]|uniref:ankyrin repeat and LEM domain-containing protein 1 isoform X3 n=1 Tax=Hyla sarda TaxID=327740 RepID=UPI0024C3F2A6|nr:ankyrin repeat and LEM domain-containing protein 1 isoform X3 [Hyla sarda]
MEELAGRLCEAVENEDAKFVVILSFLREVENLLKNGADPNLVLSTGIAAIHLASGKENECALRCLTLILQHGGNPNVRSTDDLTPVHVAASWGCCKALIFLLRKGGNPSIQDQDGNTALDLALMENNRRCVVTLQEHKERMSDQLAELDEIHVPKTVTPNNHMDNAATSVPEEITVMSTKEECRREEINYCTKIMKDKFNPTETVPVTRTLQSSHCSEYFSTCEESKITLDNSFKSKKIDCEVSIKTRQLVDNNCESNTRNTVHKVMTLNNSVRSNIKSSEQQYIKSKPELDHIIKDIQVFEKLKGLDVTSPDHAYTYNKEYNDGDMDKTSIMCGNTSEKEVRSKYRECNTNPWNSDDRQWVFDKINNSLKESNGNGICTGLSKKYTGSTIHAHGSGPVDAWKEDNKAIEMDELTGARTQIDGERSCTLTVECTKKTVRALEMQCTSSSTLPVKAINSEHGSQDLQIQLRNLLMSTKPCHRIGLEAACVDTAKLNVETESTQHSHIPSQKVIDVNSSSSSSAEDTFIIGSQKHYVSKKEVSELHEHLNKMMLETKNFLPQSINNEDKIPFFTPRTKSRLHSYKFRQNTSLFDDSVKMPKRGRRVRSPDGLLGPSKCDPPPNKFPDMTHKVIKMSNTSGTINTLACNSPELTSTNKITQDHRKKLSEPETALNITNFLTDDLSSETEERSSRHLKQTTSNNYAVGEGFDSEWLTEDGESEFSGVADLKNGKASSTMENKLLPESSYNDFFFHSTLIEDKAVNSCKVPRYSFSKLSCISKTDESTVSLCLSTVHDVSQEVPLSPGGRPINVSQAEPVEYLYKDNEKGHVLIEKHLPSIDQSDTDTSENSNNTILYDWRDYKSNTVTINKASSLNSPNRVAVELYRLSNNEIASRLIGLGEDPGQVTTQNRKMCILLLDKRLKEQTSNKPQGLSFEYSPELCLALHTFNIPDCSKDEAELSQEFDQPDKTRKWREGVLKSSFNYLLLDPRVTQNLPSRCQDLSKLDCFRTFVSAVFYVGKGKRSRPYCHLYEALTHYKGSCKQPCSKVQHIIDIWKSGQGVLSLHCFQNTIPVEAYTREACMVDAIGLKMLTNQKKGIYYGQAQNWTLTRRRCLGVHMLYKAMQIFLAEGDRQLRPPDIRSGQ